MDVEERERSGFAALRFSSTPFLYYRLVNGFS
jgi:hypothetical protein